MSGLPTSEVAVLADAAQERFFAKGAVVFREEMPASAMHFVAEGALANHRRGIRVGVVGPGGGIGGLAVLARGAMGSHVVAEEDTLTLEIDADAVAEVLEDRLPILQYLLREVNRQALELLRRHRLDPGPFFPLPHRDLGGDGGLDLVDRLLVLRRMPVFERTSVTALAELARTMAHVRFEPGTLLWQEGEPSHGMLLLSSGSVQARGSGGRELPCRSRVSAGRARGGGAGAPLVRGGARADGGLQAQTDVLVDLFEDSFDMAMDYLARDRARDAAVLDWSAAGGAAARRAGAGNHLAAARTAGLSAETGGAP